MRFPVTITRNMSDAAGDNPREQPSAPDAESARQDAIDAQLVVAAHAGDQGAVVGLLERYQDRLFGVFLRMLGTDRFARQTATDLCQDAMVRLVQGLGGFDRRSKFSTWAIRVAMNVCLTHLRSQRLRQTVSLDTPANPRSGGADSPVLGAERAFLGSKAGSVRNSAETPADGELSGGSRVEHEERRAMVASALDALDSRDRAIVILRDVQGLEYEQIAEILGVPLGTVKSRLFRARVALRERVQELEGKDSETGAESKEDESAD